MSERLLDRLVGEQLSSVIFVQDYLQLDFDGKRLTLNVWPTIRTARATVSFGDASYRDSLCALIAAIVTNVIETDQGIRLLFDSAEVEIELSVESEIEQVIYDDKKHWGFW